MDPKSSQVFKPHDHCKNFRPSQTKQRYSSLALVLNRAKQQSRSANKSWSSQIWIYANGWQHSKRQEPHCKQLLAAWKYCLENPSSTSPSRMVCWHYLTSCVKHFWINVGYTKCVPYVLTLSLTQRPPVLPLPSFLTNLLMLILCSLLSHQSRHLDTRPVILTCNGLIGLNHLHILPLLSVMGKTYTVPFIKGWMVYGGVHVAVKHFDLNKNYDTTVPFSIHQQVPPTLQCLILSVLRISSHYKVCRNASSEQYRKQMYLHILLPPAHLLPLLHLWWTKI